ncbi:hypothetical protein ACFU53_21095 [Streptomyces sp. NPDC057474]|uniref:hypothetical protein n=1 Tax=Streptomyces sp. NPDC057474 TaxID=3346144 RepID=UPI003689FE9B
MNLDKQRQPDGSGPEPPSAPRRSWGIPRWVELLVLAATAVGGFFGGQVVVVDRGSGDDKPVSAPTVTATATVTVTPSPDVQSATETPTDDSADDSTDDSSGGDVESAGEGRQTYLADLDEVTGGGDAVSAPATMLGQNYPKAVRLNCNETGKSVVYNVSGYKTLRAEVGIAADSYNAIKSVGDVWVSSAAGNRIGQPVETRSSAVRTLSVDISGQDQVQITCVMTKSGSEGKSYFTMALGDAVLLS